MEPAAGRRVDPAGNDLARFLIERDLPGAIDGRSNPDGLGIGTDRGGRVSRGNDLLHAPDSSCKNRSHNGHNGYSVVILSGAKDPATCRWSRGFGSVIQHPAGGPSHPFGMTDREFRRY